MESIDKFDRGMTLKEKSEAKAILANQQARATAEAMLTHEQNKAKVVLLTRHLTAAKHLQNTSASYFRKMEYQKKNKAKYPLNEVLKWKAVFDVYDTDKSGEITLEEFNEATSLSDTIERLKFDDLDLDKDGVITFKELLTAVYPYASATQVDWMVEMAYANKLPKALQKEKKRILTKAQYDEISAIFRLYDSDGSDTLSLQELTAGLSNSGYDVDEIRKIFEENDYDGSAELSLDEFVTLISDAYLN